MIVVIWVIQIIFSSKLGAQKVIFSLPLFKINIGEGTKEEEEEEIKSELLVIK